MAKLNESFTMYLLVINDFKISTKNFESIWNWSERPRMLKSLAKLSNILEKTYSHQQFFLHFTRATHSSRSSSQWNGLIMNRHDLFVTHREWVFKKLDLLWKVVFFIPIFYQKTFYQNAQKTYYGCSWSLF